MFKWFGKVNYTPYTKVSDFAGHLKDGRLMASKCNACGATSFPPRADCEACMSGDFEFVEVSGKATVNTFTKIVAAPTGFGSTSRWSFATGRPLRLLRLARRGR